MTTALEIAKFFIHMGALQAENKTGDGMTNLRLNKMLYFAQGYTMERLGHKLFEDKIEAWQYGPVVPSIYEHYRCCGNNMIPDTDFNRDTVSGAELTILFDVLYVWEKYSTSEIINKTHEDGTPWKQVYEDGKKNEIPDALMAEYFKDHALPKRQPKAKIVQPLRYNEKGIPVFSEREVLGYA